MTRTPMPKKPFIPAQGCFALEALYTYLGQRCENVFHILQGDGSTPATVAQMQAAAAAYVTWENTRIVGQRSTLCSLTEIICRDLSTESGVSVAYTTGLPVPGTQPTAALPSNVTLAVKWSTALGGRSHRGRTFHIGLTTGMVTGDTMNPANLTAMITAYTNLITDMPAHAPGAQLVVLSYAHNKAWRAAAVATPIIAASADQNTDSQRRRLVGRGS